MLILSKPAIYSLEITPACNNHCPGCSNVYASSRGGGGLETTEWEQILAKIGPDAARIRISGGEPTLHPGFPAIFERAAAYDAWVTIFTNGRWRDPQGFINLVRQKENRAGLLISLHGSTAAVHEAFTHTPGSFEETLSNIRRARSAGVTVAISTVLNRQNLGQIEELVTLAEAIDLEHIAFNRYIGQPLSDEPTLEELRPSLTFIESLVQAGRRVQHGIGVPQCFIPNSSEGCLAGTASASVDPWGAMHPCIHSPTNAGSLLTNSVESLWHSPPMQRWREIAQSGCVGCAAFSVCHGGCRANIELRQGRDPLCEAPLASYTHTEAIHNFPANAHPCLNVRLRPEPFGYTILGEGQILPVVPQAAALIGACSGQATFADISERFGQGGLDLLGDLWDIGILKVA